MPRLSTAQRGRNQATGRLPFADMPLMLSYSMSPPYIARPRRSNSFETKFPTFE